MTECPRCRNALDDGSMVRGSGPFRSAFVDVLRCRACGVIVLDAARAARMLANVGLGGDATERDRRPTRRACATLHCWANLDAVTLGWGTRWAVVDECPRCHLLVAAPGELDLVTVLRG